MTKFFTLAMLLGIVAATALVLAAAPSPGERRERAGKAVRQGNWKDAFEDYRALATDPEDDPKQAGEDLLKAIACLNQLSRLDEVDDFRDAVVEAHKGHWRVLGDAADSLAQGHHFGFLIAGKFARGPHRGGGRHVDSLERDRVQALRLLARARKLAEDDPDRDAVAAVYLLTALVLRSEEDREGDQGWSMQLLTDLNELPDYEDGWGADGNPRIGAPVDAQGNPVYFHVPETYDAARDDGERWRWMIARAEAIAPGVKGEARSMLAAFFLQQFGVQTMAGEPLPSGPGRDDGKEDESGPFAVGSLGEGETIARLATGIKRFKLPDEFNPIAIYRSVKDEAKGSYGEAALGVLARIFADRRQYPKAAAFWRENIEKYGPGGGEYKKKALEQIVGNWGQFGNGATQPAGKAAEVEFRFRNGKKVHFAAREIRVGKLLDDTKTYLKSLPAGNNLDWNKVNLLSNVGYLIVTQDVQDEAKYVGDEAAAWDLELDPRPEHLDRLLPVATPLKKAGAYLLTAKMEGGNTSKIVVWVADTTILKKATPDGGYYFVADAVTGKPIPKINVEFFGYKQEQVEPNKGIYRIVTSNFAEFTDADGQVSPAAKDLRPEFQWIAMARGEGGRLAFVGFSSLWHQPYDPGVYDQTKVFLATDRPVYRPGQAVKYKFWARQARYDEGDDKRFANKAFRVKVNNPKGETVFERDAVTDAFGGIDGEYTPPKDATLGAYALFLDGQGGGSFRVEEYKKPEFEVSIDAPTEPVRLGEKVEATLKAKYYFGAPVTEAKVSYKITRTAEEHSWFPHGEWDWLYGPGYGWFGRDYPWYPGWALWGCKRVYPFPWWGGMSQGPPEVVAQGDVPIGPDGTVKLTFDTAAAKANHPDQDHRYQISAEVVDASRRTIVGGGRVLVARKPFRVFAWLDRGYYRTGQDIRANFSAQTLDNKPIKGKGVLTLLRVRYDDDGKAIEEPVKTWDLDTDEQGKATLQLKASEEGQFRLAYQLTDTKGRSVEGGYLFLVRGEKFDGREFRFNDVEVIADKRDYAPGETVRLLVNANKSDATVLLFVRPVNGVVLPPKVLRLDGKSTVVEIGIARKDMPNIFVEALTIADGKIHDEVMEIIVPPEKKTINVEVVPSRAIYKPGAPAKIKVKLTDIAGKPFVGSTALTMYDKGLEYIAGGSNVPEIRAFFWKWRRMYQPRTESSLDPTSTNLVPIGQPGMQDLGAFGNENNFYLGMNVPTSHLPRDRAGAGAAKPGSAPMGMKPRSRQSALGLLSAAKDEEGFLSSMGKKGDDRDAASEPDASAGELVQPTLRKLFADAALWAPSLTADKDGIAEVGLTMPENLTGWKVRAWSIGAGTVVGQGEAEVTTAKDLLIRMQAPRFFVQKDEVVLSANIHNYLKVEKDVKAVLELDGKVLATMTDLNRNVRVPAGGEVRVDWRVRVAEDGEAVVRMKALTDEESDAMEMRFPALVHGMLKTESFTGSVRPAADSSEVKFRVPDARRKGDSRIEVRYSPTLAGAMVDALPYLVDYPFGCTEQTLNRFLPTVMTQGVLRRMGVDLKEVQKKRTNLNAQEIGDDPKRAQQWKRDDRNPVFDEDEVRSMVKEGLKDLAAMQNGDGGWGWFSGTGEHSDAHMTSQVVHGLQLARANEVAIIPEVLERGVAWLKTYQTAQVTLLKNAATETKPFKTRADALDAFVYYVLSDADSMDRDLLGFLDRDRPYLSVYGLTMLGLAVEKQCQKDVLARVLKNVEQFLVRDPENQTAYLRLARNSPWWYWYGSEVETQASYLKLLARTDAKGEVARELVKYLLNNRKHATYWNSTRDTALCVEAMAEFLKASGEDTPDMVVSVTLDGVARKEVKIEAKNLFTFDNAFVLTGEQVTSGEHRLEVARKGKGPVYFNAYLTYFTLEDPITRTGLEVKVNRKLYKVREEEGKTSVAGSRGQVVSRKIQQDRRAELKDSDTLKSGDLVEVELEIDSKNDYEYLAFEDMKAAGFEPVDLRSGYNGNDMGAYMELRDQKVCFFARTLARGKHSVRYRLRAEIPGKFSVLPTIGYGMYAPELRGNSDEAKVAIDD